MPDILPRSLLALWKRARKSTPRPPDPADMGTAFGMEAFLEAPAPAPAPAPSPSRAWLDRRRSGKASG
jgi:hypothetical protein